MVSFFVSPVFIWLALMALFIIVEIITVGLTSIWFAGGALAALISSLAGISVFGQIVLFFAVSFALLMFTKPFVSKFVQPHTIKTNYEDVVGKEVLVTARINNREGTGTAIFNGQEWTARSVDDSKIIEAGQTAYVEFIKGVKLYVK